MIVERERFLKDCGVTGLAQGCFLKYDSDVGHTAWMTWSRDGELRLTLYSGPRGFADDVMIDIWGRYDEVDDTFDIQSNDERPEAARKDDIEDAIASFRRHLPNLTMSIG